MFSAQRVPAAQDHPRFPRDHIRRGQVAESERIHRSGRKYPGCLSRDSSIRHSRRSAGAFPAPVPACPGMGQGKGRFRRTALPFAHAVPGVVTLHELSQFSFSGLLKCEGHVGAQFVDPQLHRLRRLAVGFLVNKKSPSPSRPAVERAAGQA